MEQESGVRILENMKKFHLQAMDLLSRVFTYNPDAVTFSL